MKYRNAIITLGILIAIILSPFIGVPRSWKEGVAIILALCVSMLAYIGSRASTVSAVSARVSSTAPVSPETHSSNPQ